MDNKNQQLNSKKRDLLVKYEKFKLFANLKFSCADECIDFFLQSNFKLKRQCQKEKI